MNLKHEALAILCRGCLVLAAFTHYEPASRSLAERLGEPSTMIEDRRSITLHPAFQCTVYKTGPFSTCSPEP